jgi:hypothetical protein
VCGKEAGRKIPKAFINQNQPNQLTNQRLIMGKQIRAELDAPIHFSRDNGRKT